MRKRLTKAEAIKRAAEDFKALILYYNVTRPQQLPYFRLNGRFSAKELKRQMNFGCKRMSSIKPEDPRYGYFRACQTHFNYTFGIPTERIKKVLSSYRDDEGKTHYIHIDDVLPLVEADIGHIDHKAHGVAWGKYSYHGKWLIGEEVRDKYLKDSKWSDIRNAPVSERIKKMIFCWVKSDIERNKKADDTTPPPQKDVIKEQAIVAEVVEKKNTENHDDMYDDIPPLTPPQPQPQPQPQPKPRVDIPEQPATRRELSVYQKMRLDEYVERHMSGVLTRERLDKYMNEDFGGNAEALAYVKNALEKGTTK